MSMETVRRLAANILNVGENRIRISPESTKDALGALTRTDVRSLIEKGVITKVAVIGRASSRKRTTRGHGRIRHSRVSDKVLWMQKIRSQRKLLFDLLEKGLVPKDQKWVLYGKVKSGIFKNKRGFILYLTDNKLLPKDFVYEKGTKVDKSQKTTKVEKPKVKKGEKK